MLLDGGPKRVPRPVERRPEYRQGSVRRAAETPEPSTPAPEPPTPTPRASYPPPAAQSSGNNTLRQPKRLPWRIISFVVGILLLIAAGWYVYSSTQSNGVPGIDGSKYQAVFIAGGQVYFGKLESINSDYMKLKQVFYVNSSNPVAKDGELETKDGASMQLIKLGDEVHSPEDEMMINRDQVLFVENLKPDGRVAELIDNYQKDKK